MSAGTGGAAASLYAVLGVRGVTGFASAMAQAGAITDKTAGKIDGRLNKLGSGMTRSGMLITKSVTLPLLGIGAAAVKTTMDFDKEMSKVKALSGATGKGFDQLRADAIKLGAQTQFSAGEAAQGMANFAAAGLKPQQVMKAMPGLLSAAAASGEDLASVSEILVSTMTGFGLAAGQSTHVANVLAVAANESTASIGDLGESMKYVSGIARNTGLSLESASSMVALMANAGIKGSQAGTSLRMALQRLVKPLPDRAQENLKKISPALLEISNSADHVPVKLAKMSRVFQSLSGDSKTAAASYLFGTEAMSGMLAVMNAGPAKVASLTHEMQDSDGAAAAMAKTMQDNLAGSVEQLKGSLQSAGIAIGDNLKGPIRGVATALTGAVNAFNALPQPVQESIVLFGTMAAVIGPAELALGGLMKGAARLGTLGGILRPAAAGVEGVGLAAGAAEVGVGAMIAASAPAALAIGGLGLAAYIAYKHFHKTGETTDALKDKIAANASETDRASAAWHAAVGRQQDLARAGRALQDAQAKVAATTGDAAGESDAHARAIDRERDAEKKYRALGGRPKTPGGGGPSPKPTTTAENTAATERAVAGLKAGSETAERNLASAKKHVDEIAAKSTSWRSNFALQFTSDAPLKSDDLDTQIQKRMLMAGQAAKIGSSYDSITAKIKSLELENAKAFNAGSVDLDHYTKRQGELSSALAEVSSHQKQSRKDARDANGALRQAQDASIKAGVAFGETFGKKRQVKVDSSMIPTAAQLVQGLHRDLDALPTSKTITIGVRLNGTELGAAMSAVQRLAGSAGSVSVGGGESAKGKGGGKGLSKQSFDPMGFDKQAVWAPSGLAQADLKQANLDANQSLPALATKADQAWQAFQDAAAAEAKAKAAYATAGKKKKDDAKQKLDSARSNLASAAGNVVSARGSLKDARAAAAQKRRDAPGLAQDAALSAAAGLYGGQETDINLLGGDQSAALMTQYQNEVAGYQQMLAAKGAAALTGDHLQQAKTALLTAQQNISQLQQAAADAKKVADDAAQERLLSDPESSNAGRDQELSTQYALKQLAGDNGGALDVQRQMLDFYKGEIDGYQKLIDSGTLTSDQVTKARADMQGAAQNAMSVQQSIAEAMKQPTWLEQMSGGWSLTEARLGANSTLADLMGDSAGKKAAQTDLLNQYASEVAGIQGQIGGTSDPTQLLALYQALGTAASNQLSLKQTLDPSSQDAAGAGGSDSPFFAQQVGGSGSGGNAGTSISSTGGSSSGVGYVPDPDQHPVFYGANQVNTLGWDANGGVGVKVCVVNGWDEAEDAQIAVDNRVGQDGEIPRELLLGGSTVVLSGIIGGSSQQDLYARRKTLRAIFVPTQAEQTLKMPDRAYTGAISTTYSATMPGYLRKGCRVTGLVQWGEQVGVNSHRFTITLRASDPRRFDDVPLSVTSASVATLGTGVAYPRVYASAFAFGGSGGTATVNNTGDYQAPWTVRVYGPASNPIVEDTSGLGQVVTTNLTINSGDFVDFDMVNRTAYYNGDTTQNRFGQIDFTQTTWWLLPPGSSTVRLRGANVADPARIVVTARPAYI